MAYRDTILADTPLMYLELENNVTDTQAFTGTTAGSISYVTGKVGQAGSAAGTMVTLNSTNSYFNSRVFSVEFWVKWTSTSSQTFFNRGSSLPGLKILSNSSGNIQVNASGNSNQITLVSPAAYNNGAWHHVVYVMESATSSKLYVDGSLVVSDTTTNVGSSMNMTGSATIGASGNSFQLDEFAIYSSALTSTKVTNHYNAGSGPVVVNGGYSAQAMTATSLMVSAAFSAPVSVSAQAMTSTADITSGTTVSTQKMVSVSTRVDDDTNSEKLPAQAGSTNAGQIFMHFAAPSLPSDAIVDDLVIGFAARRNVTGGTTTVTLTLKSIDVPFDPDDSNIETTPPSNGALSKTATISAAGSDPFVNYTVSWPALGQALKNGTVYGVRVFGSSEAVAFTSPLTATLVYRTNGERVVVVLPLTGSALMVNPSVSAGSGAVNSVLAMTASANIITPQLVVDKNGIAVAQPMLASAVMLDAQVFTPDRTVFANVATGSAAMPGGAFSSAKSVTANPATANAQAVDITVATEHNAIISVAAAVSTGLMMAPVQAQSNETDPYFNRIKTFFGTAVDGTQNTGDIWLRLDETSGTTAVNLVGEDGEFIGGPTFGGIGPEQRKTVHFDGINDYVRLPDSDRWTVGGTLEITFRTTKKNADIVGGVDYITPNNFAGALYGTLLGLRDGKIYSRPGYGISFTGRTNLADGNWHHVVVIVDGTTGVSGTYPGRLNVYVDGRLELRRYLDESQQITVIPDVLGAGFGYVEGVARPGGVRIYGNAPYPGAPQPYVTAFNDESSNFEGDIMEFVYVSGSGQGQTSEFPEADAIENYYAAFGIIPVRVPAMSASASMSNATGKGNQARALMLYYDANYDDNFEHAFGSTLDYNWTGLRFGTGILANINVPFDFEGYKVFAKSVRANSNGGYLGGSYYDDITGEPRLIDISRDIDASEYDLVFFLDVPPTRTNDERLNFENMVQGVADAQREHGFSLWVPQPEIAIALGIIDRVEVHSMLRGKDGHASAVSPFNLKPDANGVYDTHAVDKYRITANVEGLTTLGGYVLEDYVYSLPYGGQNFDVPIEAWDWEEKPNGLQIGDEMYFHIDFFWSAGSSTYLTGGSAYARYSVVSVPAENVRAGTVVAREIANYWDDTTLKVNPWKDNATVIALEPGDNLKGQPVGGKIFVNFMESPAGYLIQNKKQLVPPNELIANPDDRETAQMRDWEYSSFRISRQRQSVGGDIGAISDSLPAGSPEMAKYLDWLALQALHGSGGANLFQVIENQKYAVESLPFYNMSSRGFIWMSDRVEIAEGDKVIRTTPATASANVVQPTVTVEKDAKVAVQASIANAQIVNPAEVHSPHAAVMVLPATAQAVMTGYGKYISVAPATAVATMVENFDLVHAGGEQVVLYLHYSDVIVYLKEDA